VNINCTVFKVCRN